MDGTPRDSRSFRQRLRNAYNLKKNWSLLLNRPSDHVAEIDGIRALSIIFVVMAHLVLYLQFFYPPIQHFAATLPRPLRFIENGGFLGVCVFFVISGYLISTILFTEYHKTNQLRLGHFYYRRFLRLMPVYWVCLITGAVAGFPNAQNAWANVLYVNNFLSFDHTFLGWTWSLAVEEQFYFLFPLALLVFFSRKSLHTKPGRLLTVFYLLLIGIPTYIIYHYRLSQPPLDFSSTLFKRFGDLVYVKPYTGFGAILAGIVVSYVENVQQRNQTIANHLARYQLSKILLLLALSGILISFLIGDPGTQQGIVLPNYLLGCYASFFAACVAYVIFYLRSFTTPSVTACKKFLKARFLYVIAQLSYSAYLFHLIILLPTYYLLKKSLPFLSYGQLLVIGAPIVCTLLTLTCVCTYLFIERPFMNFRKK